MREIEGLFVLRQTREYTFYACNGEAFYKEGW